MKRPKPEIKKDKSDLVIEIVGLVALAVLIGLPLLKFGDLPGDIPRHFGFNGEPDAFGNKWIVPIQNLI